MGDLTLNFTIVPTWVIQDVIVYLFGLATLVFIITHEEHPISRLLEFVGFVVLNAAVFENFATLMGWYGYGRSLLMLFNVPLSVPVMEYVVVYCGLRLADAMDIPTWSKPIFVGFLGTLTDFSLDPLALSQRYDTLEGVIGRWTWYPGVNDIQIFGIPIYNFTGWFLLCGFAAMFLLLGRAWHKKSGYKKGVGLAYPPLTMLASLLLLMNPVSNFLLWLEPLMQKGSIAEVIMLGVALALFIMVLVLWKGRMKRAMSWEEDYPILLTTIGFHASNLLFTVIGGYWSILPLTAPIALVHCALVLYIYHKGRKLTPAETT